MIHGLTVSLIGVFLMARKSIKGYAEKNYYDNTKFTGGIVATNDPLNEGSFKHLVNFDISDMGQSITPRKGFLTTTLKAKLPLNNFKNISIAFNVKNINNSTLTDLTNTTWNIPAGWTATADYGRFVISFKLNGEVGYIGLNVGRNDYLNNPNVANFIYATSSNGAGTSLTPSNSFTIEILGGDTTNTKLISWLEKNGTQVVSTSTYKAEISGITDHPEWAHLMKYIDLYSTTETVYITFGKYNSTVETPYTVSLTESGVYFKMVYPYPGPYEFTVPWDGSTVTVDLTKPAYDMYIPRIDFYLDSNLQKDETITAILNNNTIYFYDINLNQYIFLDLATSSNLIHHAWHVNLNIQGTYITECEHIKYVDTSDLLNILPTDTFVFSSLHVVNNPQALHIVDEYMINSYIIKVAYTYTINNIEREKQFWLKMYYRKDPTDTLTGDTLVLTYLDTDDIVNYVDPTKRNLASSQDIIPSDFQIIHSELTKPIGFIQEFPMIYVQDDKGNYIVNSSISINNLTIIPHFYLNEPYEDHYWAYTYDITKMYNTTRPMLNTETVYSSAVYNLSDNTLIDFINNPGKNITDIYQKYIDTYTKMYKDSNINTSEKYLHGISTMWYRDYMINKTMPNISEAIGDSYIVYIVPKPLNTTLEIPCVSTGDEYHKYVNLGFGGLSSYFTGARMRFDMYNTRYVEDTITNEYIEILDKVDPTDSLPISIEEFKTRYKKSWDIYNTDSYVLSNKYASMTDIEYVKSLIKDIDYHSLQSVLDTLNESYDFYVVDCKTLKNYTDNDSYGFDNILQTAFDSPIIAFSSNSNKKNAAELYTYLTADSINSFRLVFNIMKTSTNVRLYTYTTHQENIDDDCYITDTNVELLKLFPESVVDTKIATNTYKDYRVCIGDIKDSSDPVTMIVRLNSKSNSDDYHYVIKDYITSMYAYDSETFKYYGFTYNNLFKPGVDIAGNMELTLLPTIGISHDNIIYNTIMSNIDVNNPSLFTVDPTDSTLKAVLNESNSTYNLLNKLKYFDEGVNITFYLLQVPTQKYIDEYKGYIPDFDYTREYLINTTSLYNNRQIILSKEEPTIYTRILVDDPNNIKNATEYLSYNSLLGEHMIIYKDNILYISKENIPYYFPEENKKVFPEPIVKALQYKDLLLVFTVQNLYAVYLYETTVNVENGTDDEGNTKYVQQKVYNFASLPVLYNIMVNEKYKDAIQVYNQMILFYSADGQMFLIKPTAAIDSNTRFSIQYFNKSANDILLNYKQYIQERLVIYGIDPNIKDEDITIKVVANINHIKIFYNVPGKITYILVYDVLNNRYYTYDTVSFSNVRNIHYTPDGELYITEHKDKLYFTTMDNSKQFIDSNVDIAYYNNFSPMPIQCELDTGTINLNNHLKKRFKDLRIIYKNLDANELEFKLEAFVDDIPTITYIDTALEIKDVSGYNTLTVTEINKVIQLLKNNALLITDPEKAEQLVENNALFNFADYNSNKIITHRTNITNRGKSIRFKMNFSSKGKYKIQGYGVIYKEHTV